MIDSGYFQYPHSSQALHNSNAHARATCRRQGQQQAAAHRTMCSASTDVVVGCCAAIEIQAFVTASRARVGIWHNQQLLTIKFSACTLLSKFCLCSTVDFGIALRKNDKTKANVRPRFAGRLLRKLNISNQALSRCYLSLRTRSISSVVDI